MGAGQRGSSELASRLVDVLVLAPLGAGARLVDEAPGVIARARQELSNARFVGRMVVEQGASQLGARLNPADGGVIPDSRVRQVVDPIGARPSVSAPIDAVDPCEPAADELVIPDYDHLPAVDIIEQLTSLSADELASVERYERDHRRRRTVLGKITQLQAAS